MQYEKKNYEYDHWELALRCSTSNMDRFFFA